MLDRLRYALLILPLACAVSESDTGGHETTLGEDSSGATTAEDSSDAGATSDTSGAGDDGESTGGGEDEGMTGTMVTFTVYVDDTCTDLPPVNSTVTLDATLPCNATPDASISDLKCYADRITYTNHPNNPDCSSTGIPNELFVGACQQFPGPVATWKLIEAGSYKCMTAP